MPDEKIKISFEEVYSEKVDVNLKKNSALSRAEEHQKNIYVSHQQDTERKKSMLWYNSTFYLALFGLIGGLIAWGSTEIVWSNYDHSIQEYSNIIKQGESLHQLNRMSESDAQKYLAKFSYNPFIAIHLDISLTQSDKTSRSKLLIENIKTRNWIVYVIYDALAGLVIAMFLSAADYVVSKNYNSAIINASVGAFVGLVACGATAWFSNYIYNALGGGKGEGITQAQIIARAISWAMFGSCIAISPGILLFNKRKLLIGVVGGFAGGFLGGLVFDLFANGSLSRFAGIIAIGVFTGVGISLVENALKSGWLMVIDGLLRGKQFVIYKNPTTIGSSPNCEIYLFKDQTVAPRHAAIHITPRGFSIESIGNGPVYVNGANVHKHNLRAGDTINIGASSFNFNSKSAH